MTSATCSRLAVKATVHCLALTTLCVAMGLMHVVVKPFPRKFFCDDQSIRYPRGGCTVPYYVCAPVGVLAAWLTVALAEWGRARAAAGCWSRPPGSRSRDPRHLRSLLAFARRSIGSEFKARYLAAVLHGVYHFCLGLAACDFLMGMAKNVFGRHRPFFYTVCRPELPTGGCNASVAYDVSVCRPEISAREFDDAQRSFPSGHASFGLYCAAYIVLYLHRRGGRWLAPMLRRAVQFAAATCGLYVAYSRVPDYKHHWSDVLAGGLLGVCLAWAAALAVPAAAAARDEAEADADEEETDAEEGVELGAAVVSGKSEVA